MRRFHFIREKDASGISGVGKVAEGVIFSDGKVALEWFGEHSSTNLYKSLEDVEYIHGHAGMTKIIFEDPEETPEVSEKDEMKNAN
jgi:hypothetical protein